MNNNYDFINRTSNFALGYIQEQVFTTFGKPVFDIAKKYLPEDNTFLDNNDSFADIREQNDGIESALNSGVMLGVIQDLSTIALASSYVAGYYNNLTRVALGLTVTKIGLECLSYVSKGVFNLLKKD